MIDFFKVLMLSINCSGLLQFKTYVFLLYLTAIRFFKLLHIV